MMLVLSNGQPIFRVFFLYNLLVLIGSLNGEQDDAVKWSRYGDKLSDSLDRLSRTVDRCQRVDGSNLDELVHKFKTSSQLEDEIQTLRKELYELKSEMSLAMRESRAESLSRGKGEEVFFNAYSSREIHCFDCTVTYESEYADSHNAMDHQTGRFVCPATGHYLFQFHSVAEKGHEVQIWMKVNGQDVIALNDWDQGSGNRRVSVISQAVIQKLSVGDVVYVQLHRGKLKGHGSGPVYTSFLGTKVGGLEPNEI